MPVYNILFEVSPLVGTTPTTLRLTNIDADTAATGANNQAWLPCITQLPTVSVTVAEGGLLRKVAVSRGEIKFFCNDDFDNHKWSGYWWAGALGRAWIGERDAPFVQYTKIFEGAVSNLERDGNQVTVRLLGQEATITNNILTDTYAGTGKANGPSGLKGRFKPRAYGSPKSIEPVELDPNNLVYQVHGYGAVSAILPYEYGSPLSQGLYVGNATTYGALIDLTLTPGQWATCHEEGLFRLGGTPTPKLTADVVVPGGNTLDLIATKILGDAGVIPGRIGSFGAFAGVTTDLYITEEEPVDEVLSDLFYEAGGFMLVDKNGVFQCGTYYNSAKAAVVLKGDRSTFPVLLDWKEEPNISSLWQVRYGNTKCWGVHSDSDASPIINQLAGDTQAAQQAALDAKDTADIAKAQADAANARLASISSDSKLDRSEKSDVIRDYQAIIAEQPGISSKATGLGVTTEKTAFDDAVTALTTHLNGLSPSWTDLSTDTPIDGPVFRQKFLDVYAARQTVLNRMIEVGSTTAEWTGVSGSGKPQDNATVGAPAGTYVGDKKAEQVISDLAFNAQSYLEQMLRSDTHEAYLAVRTMLGSKPINTIVADLTKEFTDEKTATVTRFGLIGATTPDGTGFIIDADKIQSGDGRLLVSRMNSLEATVDGTDGVVARIDDLRDIVIDPSGATVRAVFRVVNGNTIGGMITTNNGDFVDMAFSTHVFRVIDPDLGGTPQTVFTIENGEVVIPRAKIRNLDVGVVTSSNMVLNAATKKYFWVDNYGAGIAGSSIAPAGSFGAFGTSSNKASIQTSNLPVGAEVAIRLFVNAQRTGSDNDRIQFRIKRTAPGGAVDYLESINVGLTSAPSVISWEWHDLGVLTAGQYTYALEANRADGGGLYYHAKIVVDSGNR